MTEILSVAYRNKSVESAHYGSIVVTDNKGTVLYYCGDPEWQTYTRSSAKPFQFVAVHESGAIAKYGHNLQQIAIMMGSHNGSELHQQVAKSNLDLIGLDESYLKCGTHVPYELTMKGYVPFEGQKFSPLAHNCSGKHSGQLALALQLGDDPKDYIEPTSRAQTRVKETVSEIYDYPIDKIETGTDGCSLPNFVMPIRNVAKAFASLVTLDTQSATRRKAFQTSIEAMTTHPLMVSGNGRVDLAVTEACKGNVVCKIGGEAIEGIGIRSKGIGVAIKIADGNPRGLNPVIVEVLRQLGVLDLAQVKSLAQFARPQLLNNRELVIGEIVPVFQLKRG